MVYLLLMCAMCAVAASAQAIKGDMNDDGNIDVTDLNETVNTMLGKRAIQYVSGGVDPYTVDNSLVVGTWYRTKNEHFTLNADGTTDYPGAETYRFYPYQGRLQFYSGNGSLFYHFNVLQVETNLMVVTSPASPTAYMTLVTEQPSQLVTAIRLSDTKIFMSSGEFKQLTATVLPEDADNKSVTWSSSNESVARQSGDFVLAVGNGTAVLTCAAQDGSGVTATCTVTVGNKKQEYVDLGLPSGTLWATTNVGADSPEDYGLYFAWGETKGYAKGESHTFSWSNYKWCNGDYDKLTKYCTSFEYWDTSLGIFPDNKTVLDAEDDAATANWGSGWRMPTRAQLEELYNSSYTTTEWTTVNGVNGRKITSKSNGNSIFLPAAGYRYDAYLSGEGSYGYYWSRELYSSDSYDAYYLFFDSSGVNTHYGSRYFGQSVRAVRVPSE